MKQVNIREFRSNLSRYFNELPIEVTSRGKTVAVVQKASQFKMETETEPIPTEAPPPTSPEPLFSDAPKPGYKFVPFLGKYKKDDN